MREYGKILFRGRSVVIGRWRCPANVPDFTNTGPTEYHEVVFPRTAVQITHEGNEPVIADPSVVTIYNCGQHYTRSLICERGDYCDWFGLNDEAAVEIVRQYDPDVVDHPETPYRFTCGPADSKLYLRQRLVIEHLERSTDPDPLFVEETALEIVSAAIGMAFGARREGGRQRRVDTRRAHRDLVHGARLILARRFAESISLSEIAREVYCSPFHLCRVFHEQTGMTLTAYRNELRVRRSLERVADEPKRDLTHLAIESGFSSHSHFTRSFRQAFAMAPSTLRREEPERLLRQMDAMQKS